MSKKEEENSFNNNKRRDQEHEFSKIEQNISEIIRLFDEMSDYSAEMRPIKIRVREYSRITSLEGALKNIFLISICLSIIICINFKK